MTELIIFDKDGTLMELGSVIVKLADDLINEFSLRSNIHIPKSEIKDAFGLIDDQLDKVLRADSVKSIVERLRVLPEGERMADWTLSQMEHLSTDNEVDDIEIIEGVKDTLKRLKEAGYQLAIVSADDQYSMDLFINKFELSPYFDLIVTSDNTEHQKPQKALIDEIMDKLNVTASETVMVGDTEMDVMLGRNGQVKKVIGVLSGSGDRQDLRDANLILNSVSEIHIDQIK
ncbi:HAD family hydrolase [Macrococcus brunensis]|uniref:HAD family hydrolase n=1 Tax=Macrococcus brunensis TaxID=198483 RepID=UPI001EF09081|nr:HAD family hydrolase [Macrococcus brunensis]ULG71794.1 HAD family hydrolase [Macrococcus brunensis]ULG74052.1 HAD family hydrolase [Macrococcus brunensis]